MPLFLLPKIFATTNSLAAYSSTELSLFDEN